MGLLGKALVKELTENGAEVVAVDIDEEAINDVKDIVSASFILDATDINALQEIHIDKYDAIVIAIGEQFEALLLSAFHCLNLGAKRIIVRANNTYQKTILQKIGITDVIIPEEEISKEITEMIMHPGVSESAEITSDVEFITIAVPPSFVNQKVSTIKNICIDNDIFFITIERKNSDGTTSILPPSRLKDSIIIQKDDKILLLGQKDKIYSVIG